jgi:hypothetical protein
LVTTGVRSFLFGGVEGAGFSSGLWRFDPALGDWVLVPGGGPSPRLGCAASALGTSPLLLFFGGADAAGLPADTWLLLDVGLVLWAQQVTPAGLVGRVRHALAGGPQQSAVLFGGIAGTTVLGDTWVFRGTTWTPAAGVGPPPAADARMVYDAARDMTVLLHPNGGTYEWNGFAWRQVPASGGPGSWSQPAVVVWPGSGIAALQVEAAGLVRRDFTPSPAAYETTSDLVCFAGVGGGLSLDSYQRSLPVLGQTMHLRAAGVPTTSLCFGVYEFSTLPFGSLGCGCVLGVTGVGAGVMFVPGSATLRDWFLPIAAAPALAGVAVDVQGITLDAAAPCFVMSTQRLTLVLGP